MSTVSEDRNSASQPSQAYGTTQAGWTDGVSQLYRQLPHAELNVLNSMENDIVLDMILDRGILVSSKTSTVTNMGQTRVLVTVIFCAKCRISLFRNMTTYRQQNSSCCY